VAAIIYYTGLALTVLAVAAFGAWMYRRGYQRGQEEAEAEVAAMVSDLLNSLGAVSQALEAMENDDGEGERDIFVFPGRPHIWH